MWLRRFFPHLWFTLPCGGMANTSEFGSEDWEFESLYGNKLAMINFFQNNRQNIWWFQKKVVPLHQKSRKCWCSRFHGTAQRLLTHDGTFLSTKQGTPRVTPSFLTLGVYKGEVPPANLPISVWLPPLFLPLSSIG